MRAGKCWRLYPEVFHQNFMPPHTLAEMLRTPLEELVLQVKQDRMHWGERGGREGGDACFVVICCLVCMVGCARDSSTRRCPCYFWSFVVCCWWSYFFLGKG